MQINELGMREITEEEAADLGIDLSMAGVCKTLRKLAKLDRLRLDEDEHRSGLNQHLFHYIEYCGEKPLDYIKDYLSNLQPYMIQRRKDQEKQKKSDTTDHKVWNRSMTDCIILGICQILCAGFNNSSIFFR